MRSVYAAHHEHHAQGRLGWLRAAVLGANDGLISTSSLVVGVAAAQATTASVTIAAVSGLVAGALSMAAGEYVSVSSQADAERADLNRERSEIAANPEAEKAELAGIYVDRGLSPQLALRVAEELSARDALGAHARDELGLSELQRARPVQAALASAAAFSLGAALPVLLAAFAPRATLAVTVIAATLAMLVLLGLAAAKLGRAPSGPGALRVAFWGALAMGSTFLVGRLFGAE